MAAVHGIRQPEYGIELGDPDVLLGVEHFLHVPILGKGIDRIPQDVCHHHPLFVGDADNFRGGDDFVGIFSNVIQVNICAAIMENHCNLQQKAVLSGQVVFPLQGIKNLQGIALHHAGMLQAALIAVCNFPGGG